MGKTYLLANIARLTMKHCTRKIILFIQLSTFVVDFPLISDNKMGQDTGIKNVFKHVSPSKEHAELLINLLQAELIRVEILFDGFDEIPSDKVESMKKVFLSINTSLPNVRIHITSRPHMRHELEKSLGVIAYDILPFNLQNQADYLVQFWSTNVPKLDPIAIQTYAMNCLKEISATLTKEDKEMAGIPLLCRLIAEIYANKIHFYSTSGTKNTAVPLRIAAMYHQFIELRVKGVTKSDDESKNIKLVHTSHALKKLFPTDGFHEDKLFSKVAHQVATSTVLKAGIIQLQSSTKVEFIHRTFAEYFVAEYFLRKLQSTASKPTTFFRNLFNVSKDTEKSLVLVQNVLMETSKEQKIFSLECYDVFVHSVILSFVDFGLKECNFYERMNSREASFFAFRSSEKFLSILYACFHHKLYNLFSLLKEALIKWDSCQQKKYFTRGNCYNLLEVCIEKSTSQMFHSCIQLLTEVLKLDVEQINTFYKFSTLLQVAVKHANYAAVEYFMDRAPLNNQSLLEICCTKIYCTEKSENILHLLLNKDPTLIDETPDILVSGTNVRLVKVLVKFGANLTAVNENNQNFTVRASEYNSPSEYHELVQFLLTDCKAEYLFLDHKNWRDPLPDIIKRITLLPETMELLHSIPGIGISMNERWEESLLFSAVKANDMTKLDKLVKAGVDCNARDRTDRSLLHVAASFGRVDMVRYLLSLKLDPISRDKYGRTPLHSTVGWKDNLSVVKVLVENGANVQAKDIIGQTALHFCADLDGSESIEIIRYLIGNGAKVNDRDNKGNTPLHLCLKKELIDCLIEMGAEIHAKNDDGRTVLHKVAGVTVSGYEEVVKHLIKKGAGVNDRNNNGSTPLHLCWITEVKDCLIEIGADVHAKNNDGNTPI